MTRGAPAARLTLSTLVLAVAVCVVVTSVTSQAAALQRGAGPQQIAVIAAFFVAIAVGECLRVWLPGNRDAAPIGTAASLAFALLPVPTGEVDGYGAATVVVVVTAATLVGISPHLFAGRFVDRDGVAHRLITTALLAVLFREVPLGAGGPLAMLVETWVGHRWVVALVMLTLVVLTMGVDTVLASALRAARDSSRPGAELRDELRNVLGMGSAIGSTGILIALATRPMGLLALPVFLAPLMLTQFAFRRFATVRETYNQTIRSLSKVTELGGYTETGHSTRVADLSVAIGRDLGMGERELRDLEYAALLHDIGQLSLAEPIPGGATLMAAAAEQQRIANLGAEVVRQAGVLDTVAAILEQQSVPYRRRHDVHADPVPLASRIIMVANAYDDLVGEAREHGRRSAGLERIHLGLAQEYDPRVVASLTRVLARS